MIYIKMKSYILLLGIFVFIGCSNNEGKKLPDFIATTLTGKTIKSQELNGKIVVIKIWATWCGSCIVEIPQLNKLVEKYQQDTSIVFLAITDDNAEKIQNFLARISLKYDHITDAKALKEIFQPGIRKEIPEHMVIDREGNIVFDISGESEKIGKVLSDKIEEVKKGVAPK